MSLDNCRRRGVRVRDFDPDGYERDDAQRGHFSCDAEHQNRGA